MLAKLFLSDSDFIFSSSWPANQVVSGFSSGGAHPGRGDQIVSGSSSGGMARHRKMLIRLFLSRSDLSSALSGRVVRLCTNFLQEGRGRHRQMSTKVFFSRLDLSSALSGRVTRLLDFLQDERQDTGRRVRSPHRYGRGSRDDSIAMAVAPDVVLLGSQQRCLKPRRPPPEVIQLQFSRSLQEITVQVASHSLPLLDIRPAIVFHVCFPHKQS